MKKIIAMSALAGLMMTPVALADDGKEVLHIGDSNTVGMTKEHQGDGKDIESAYKDAGFDSEISAAVSRSLVGKVNAGDPSKDEDSGVDGLKRLIGDHEDSIIVMALGVNDAAGIGSPDDAMSRIEKIMDVVEDSGNEVLWPLVTVGSEADSSIQKGSKAFNEALEEAEEEFDNLTVIDWEPEEEWFRDGVHYTPEGYENLIASIVDAVEDADSGDSDDDEDSRKDSKGSKKDSKGDKDDDSKDSDDSISSKGKSSGKSKSSKDSDEDVDDSDEEELDEDEIEQVGYSSGTIQEESL